MFTSITMPDQELHAPILLSDQDTDLVGGGMGHLNEITGATAAGAALGSVFGPVGTVVGGAVGGLLGWLFG